MQAYRQPGRQAGKQTDWQTSRQADKRRENDENGNDDDDDDDADDYLFCHHLHHIGGCHHPCHHLSWLYTTHPCSRIYIHRLNERGYGLMQPQDIHAHCGRICSCHCIHRQNDHRYRGDNISPIGGWCSRFISSSGTIQHTTNNTQHTK